MMTMHHQFSRTRLAVLLLAALSTAPAAAMAQAETARSVRFADTATLNVDVSGSTFDVTYRPPQEYPHVGYRAPITFEAVARDWVAHHFTLTGNSVNSLRIVVRDGDIVERLLPVTKGFKGWFKKDQAAEYEAKLEIETAIVNPNGMILAQAEGKAWHKRTVPEGMTEAQKQAVWAEMIKKTFDDLDLELQPKIRDALAQYVR